MILKSFINYFKNPVFAGFLLFWIIQFLINFLLQWVCRVIFIFSSGVYDHYPLQELSNTFISGIPLDISFSAYIILLQLVLFPLIVFFSTRFVHWLYASLIGLLFAVLLLVAFTDSALYKAWGSRINHDAIHFMQHPGEAFASMQLGQHSGALIMSFTGLIVFIFFLKKWYTKNARPDYKKYTLLLPLLIVVSGIIARGGIGTIPVAESSVFKTNAMPLNITAINPGWNLVYFVFNDHKPENAEKYKELVEDNWQKEVEKYCNSSLNTPEISTIEKPNVVLIIIESLNAYSSKLFGDGSKNNTPFLDSIAKEGWYFTSCFSPIDRTPRAMAAIHSAFPGIPWGTILEEPVKAAGLPMLPKTFVNNGYQSSFLYGGDLNFAEMQGYLINAGYQKLYGIEQYPNAPRDKWGVRDEYLLSKSIEIIDKQKQPFFTGMLTLSSHEPYAIPEEYTRGLGANREDFSYYFASVKYTDDCLRKFFREASSKPWFKNTVFVFCADHGRRVGVEKPENESFITHKIPLLIYGPALNSKYQKRQSKKVCSQNDIAQTLCTGILKIRSSIFPYSRNLADTAVLPFAFYYNHKGFGLIGPSGVFDYKMANKATTIESAPEEKIPGYSSMAKALQYALVLNYWKL